MADGPGKADATGLATVSRDVRGASHLKIRLATLDDVEALRDLQARAMRALAAGYYAPAEVEAAVRYVCVPDPGLIQDGTYLVAELDGRLAGCGGWSLRRKAYAGPAGAAEIVTRAQQLRSEGVGGDRPQRPHRGAP